MSDHSIMPDIFTGWQKRQFTAKLVQFPLIFMNPAVDAISKTLTTFGSQQVYRVIYMGPRHNSNMKAFKAYCMTQKDDKLNQSCVYGLKQLNRFQFKHTHEQQKYFPIRISQCRLFTGMNPTVKKDDIRFDSDFQCGNLDLAISINSFEYDLIMRVDSNTKGHTSWFYFKVSNATANQKIKFNIINFNKRHLLYKDGMKPYIFKNSIGKWTQSCTTVTYNNRRFRYQGIDQIRYQCLSFIYQFKDQQEVYFAYCIPYSYSYLLNRLQELKSKYPHLMRINYDCQSTGGLPIPVVTITNFTSSIEKMGILCSARLHPGETQGSWMMDGFMQQLLQPQSHYLRDRAVFKLIPMINVDGVVLGNFRTGIMGRDLNRCFNQYDRYNQITMVHRIAQQINPLIYIDFHGHSSKKNVFIYGPDYKLEDRNYLLCRLLPKIISKQTEAFRYYSCSFQISREKGSTGRAILMKIFKVQYCYTVQASAYAYGPSKNQTLFTSIQYHNVGCKIANSLTEFVRILKILPKRQEIKSKKEQQNSKEQDQKKQQNKIFIKQQQIQQNQNSVIKLNSNLFDLNSLSISVIQKNLFNQILKDQTKIDQQQNINRSQQSDFQDQNNDYSNTDITNIMNAKFSPPKKKNKKQKTKSPNKQQKIQKNNKIYKSFVQSKKSVQFNTMKQKKKLLKNHKSYSIKTIDAQNQVLNNSQTLDAIQNYRKKHESFHEKASKIVENNPLFMKGIITNKKSIKLIKKNQQMSPDSKINRNNVDYNWGKQFKNRERSSEHFKFQIPQYFQPISTKKKQDLPSFEKQKKKNPLLSIKKSILPMLGRSSQLAREGGDKSMLSQILQQHERNKKDRKNVKIMFL